MAIALASFEPLSDSERLILTRLAAIGGGRELTVDARPAAVAPLRSAFLGWLLCSEIGRESPAVGRFVLIGARVEGCLDLAGAELALTPSFVDCDFPAGIVLRDARLIGFEMLGGAALEIAGDRVSLKGSLHLRDRRAEDAIEAAPALPNPAPLELRRKLNLSGATIHGNLDLRSCRILGEDLPPERRVALFADGIAVDGNVLLCDGFTALGEIRLSGCRIGRNLDLSGASLRARDRLSLVAAEARVSGNLLLCQTEPRPTNRSGAAFSSIGTIRLTGTQIDGALDCDGAQLTAPAFANPPLPPATDGGDMCLALGAAGLVARGGAWMGQGFHALGCIHLVNAKIGSDLQCQGGNFDHPASLALEADGIEVTGTVFFEAGQRADYGGGAAVPVEIPAQTSGFLSFNYAHLEQGLYVQDLVFQVASQPAPARLERRGNCGLVAELVTIRGDFRLRGIERAGAPDGPGIGIEIGLRQAKADVLDDDKASWDLAAAVNVTGFAYEGIKNIALDSWRWRCAVLDKHYAARPGTPEANLPQAQRAQRFEPQPYLQLARIMQRSGFDAAATKVRIRLEDNYTRSGDFARHQRAWRHILSSTIAYGYEPWRAFYFLIGWALVSAVVFGPASAGQIVAAKDAGGSPPPLEFSAPVYALDTLVPIVDLHQKSQWVVQPPSLEPWIAACKPAAGGHALPIRLLLAAWQSVVRLVGLINPFIGWALTSLFAAGVTGLVRRGGGEG